MGASWLWLFESVREIDFKFEDFMKESFLVNIESKGGITFQDLKDMSFDEYLKIVRYAAYLQKPKEDANG